MGAARRSRNSATLRKLGIRLRPLQSFGGGFLTGAIKKKSDLGEKDFRIQRYPRFAGEAFDKNQVLVNRLTAIAQRRHVTPGQLALAWLLAKGQDIVPIPGTKRRKYLEENAAATEIRLAPEEVGELEAAVPQSEVTGDRYAPANMHAIDR